MPFGIENVSSYLRYDGDDMSEWDFLTAVLEEADCGLLLDVNNIYVSSQNHNFDPNAFVDGIPAERVVQIHLAGHSRFEKYIIDTHSGHVIDEVWALYERAIRRCGSVSTLIEWDDEIPDFATLSLEAEKARVHRANALSELTASTQAASSGLAESRL